MLNKETILLHIQIYCLLGKKAIQNLKHKTHYSTIVRVGYVCFCVSLCVIVRERERERESIVLVVAHQNIWLTVFEDASE